MTRSYWPERPPPLRCRPRWLESASSGTVTTDDTVFDSCLFARGTQGGKPILRVLYTRMNHGRRDQYEVVVDAARVRSITA